MQLDYFLRIKEMNEELLLNIKKVLPELEKLLIDVNHHWAAEDLCYRFYHQSFKCYHIQDYTVKIVDTLKSLAPKDVTKFNSFYEEIFKEGTGKVFKDQHNDDWCKHTRPMLEAFFHAKYFLEMAVKYSKLENAPDCLPSGWAGLLCFYNLR